MKKKNILIAMACVVLVALIGAGGWLVISQSRQAESEEAMAASYEKTMAELTVEIDETKLNLEYGDSFDINKLIKDHTGDMEVEEDVDTAKAGTYPVTIRLKTTDSYNQEVVREYRYEVKITDTKKPQIALAQEYVITEEGGFDPAVNVVSVTDEVDGELAYSDKKEAGSWTWETEGDPNTAGEYEIKIIATDKNKNVSEKSYILIVNGQEESAASAAPAATAEAVFPASGQTETSESGDIPASWGNYNPYYIRINRAMNTVTIYSLGDNGYVPYLAMVCSTGGATPLGTYATFNKSRWRTLYGPCYGQYVTDIVGDILFHSVPYYTMSEDDLEYEEYNKLGTAASMGCIRLCVSDALWIYNNCPIGTVVELYDDYSTPGPLGKPGSIYIDPNDERRGWDPTDPNPNNPWNG